MCLLFIMRSVLALQNNFPWEHEHMSSYCNSYSNITFIAVIVLTSCIWVFWQGAIMEAKSRIKRAVFHMKHSSAQKKECRNSLWEASMMNGLKLRKDKTDAKKRMQEG